MLSNTRLIQLLRVLEIFDELAMKTKEKMRNPASLIGWLNGDLSPSRSYWVNPPRRRASES